MKNIFTVIVTISIIIPFVSAGLFDWINPTGKVTSQPVDLEVLVGGGNPPIITVLNNTMTDVSIGPNEAPISTPITINFNAFDAEGSGNLNDSSAAISFLKAGEQTRSSSCIKTSSNSSTSTYECIVYMYWWDSPGTWDIKAEISDINNNLATDQNKTFLVGATSGFTAAPLSITWNEINPGATQVPAVELITLNNTGNLARNIQMNATDLIGLSDNSKAIYSSNMSINTVVSCGGTNMQHLIFTTITGANLPRGNYTLNDGTAQEDLYFCIEQAGSELTQQSYSTSQEGAWTMKITA